ncbi:DUF1259 domain-containing protein [Streptomyces sp. NPDC015131]|uniref:DUF1259 domain-containing protein n=1 Tax=Streptomyces sp. NPDC015131 TaxID=3364941 RepID=UPI0036FBD110
MTTEDARGTRATAPTRRRLLAAGALAPAALAPVLAGAEPAAGAPASASRGGSVPLRPLTTRLADWRRVAEVLRTPGKLTGGDTVFRANFPRGDLRVSSHGVAGVPVASYAAFARYPDGRTMLMGDVVATEPELQRVTDALQAHGLEQTAIHKHLLAHRPDLWWTHVHGMAPDGVRLARAMRAALDATSTPEAEESATPEEPVDLDTAAIDAALGARGRSEAGYRFSFARRETVSDHHYVVPAAMGVTTAITFQPVGDGRAAVSGDFVMIAGEVQAVIAALRKGRISVVELHNHGLRDEPRLFYLHFWAVGDAVRLARTLQRAKAATNVVPAT